MPTTHARPRAGLAAAAAGAVAAVALAATAGCTPPEGPGRTGSTDGAAHAAQAPSAGPGATGAAPDIPLAAYLPSGRQLRDYLTARQILANRCLAGFGFSPDPLPPAFTADDADVTSLTARRYMLADPAAARGYGYHTALTPSYVRVDRRDRAAQQAEQAARPDHRSAADRSLVSLGLDPAGKPVPHPRIGGRPVPEGGCTAQANRALTGTDDALTRAELPNTLQIDAWQQSRSDPGVKRAFAGWSACMAARGYRYADPVEADNDADWQSATPSARELATATADVACKQQAHVVTAWHAADSALQTAAIARNTAALAAVRSGLDATTARVRAVLAQPPPG
ncbi:hypothetical protein [Streptomyces sp. NRRL F-5123]|uniref:hypothetical protein n=1 Tax=Streptomyces sp. NRRL F-5123 TaxID=1463856 RepID=UPI0004E15676|nr:hypothetical protein [Streptomyces sp. NRRL F-5123]